MDDEDPEYRLAIKLAMRGQTAVFWLQSQSSLCGSIRMCCFAKKEDIRSVNHEFQNQYKTPE